MSSWAQFITYKNYKTWLKKPCVIQIKRQRNLAPPGARLRNAQCSHCSCSSCHCAANSWTAKVMVHQKLAPKALCGGTSLSIWILLFTTTVRRFLYIHIYYHLLLLKCITITITITIYYYILHHITIYYNILLYIYIHRDLSERVIRENC